jgi:flagellar motor protein MotB
MTPAGQNLAAQSRRGRWALSFADLTLLLLGFFVLLHASGAKQEEALKGIGAQFGAISTPNHVDIPSAALFAPGEALLTPEGRARLTAAAASVSAEGRLIEIQSFGTENGQQRFDAWDLAAARLGAVARALQQEGIKQERLRIAGLVEAPETDKPAPRGQVIRILTRADDRQR